MSSEIERKPRQSQQEILAYTGGRMGIAAVPGSGKTFTLAKLATKIILNGWLDYNQEVLIVTLVNSAVDNFSTQISQNLQAANLLGGMGYRVRTLHGLANDILHERPDLAGLDPKYGIIDDSEAAQIRKEVSTNWMRSHTTLVQALLKPDLNDYTYAKIERSDLPDLFASLANAFIRKAKDSQLTPVELGEVLADSGVQLPLVEMGVQMYHDYQQALRYRSAIDFDDIIRLALQCLQSDQTLCDQLSSRWAFILEDEAQDSSRLQQEILNLLAQKHDNWVRVGDPNQAIFETFTTASPQYLLDFLKQPNVISKALPQSGRSSENIIDLANYLIKWTNESHPNPDARHALTQPYITPVPQDDPFPNPPNLPEQIHFISKAYSSEDEIEIIVSNIARWLPTNLQKTCAILVPNNKHGFKVVDALQSKSLPVVDNLLQASTSTRLSANALSKILTALANPETPQKLVDAYCIWNRTAFETENEKATAEKAAQTLRNCKKIETFLYPQISEDWLSTLQENETVINSLQTFRNIVRRWHQAVYLPIDQLVLTIAQDLFLNPVELAMAYKLSSLLKQLSHHNPSWGLPELNHELDTIARNERKYLGFSEDDTGFNPANYPGQVVVATMHKAKGLEWDRVYLMSVNNYDFPSGTEMDSYISEKYFIKGGLNLEAEMLAQLSALTSNDFMEFPERGKATIKARHEYIRERLRLLYVGISRARQQLIVSYNTGRLNTLPSSAALPMVALREYWELAKNDD